MKSHAKNKATPKQQKIIIPTVILGLIIIFGLGFVIKGRSAPAITCDTSINYQGSSQNTSILGGFKWGMKIPDGWVVSQKSWKQGILFADDLTYTPGLGMRYTEVEPSSSIVRFNAAIGDPEYFPKEYDSYSKSKLKCGLLNGTLYTHTFTKGEKIGNYEMQGGETDRTYHFIRGDTDMTVTYYRLEGDKDQTKLIDATVATLHLDWPLVNNY